MKKLVTLPLLALLLAHAVALPLHAEDRIREIQTELKTQGFYYGEINGTYSPETTAALRRYQIRNGLEVTGTLTDETTKSLGTGQPAVAPKASPPAPSTTRPPARNSAPLEESDRNFLRREEAKPQRPPVARVPDESAAPPNSRRSETSSDLAELFADTPFANAPREVQESTLRRAQSQLASRGYYRQASDGSTGPATEEALLTYQRATRLPLTGRLDLETLSALRLLPGRSPLPLQGLTPGQRPGAPPVYRGIWVR